jgi:putative PIN family toxin of toxin-antitoxin system
MIVAVLDTNVLVQSLIGSHRSASVQVVEALLLNRFQAVFSPETIDELIDVLNVPHIRARHRLTAEELEQFVSALLSRANLLAGASGVSPSLPRDATDAKLLALAEQANADFLVTNDHRHLLRLRRFLATSIVTPAQFLKKLEE